MMFPTCTRRHAAVAVVLGITTLAGGPLLAAPKGKSKEMAEQQAEIEKLIKEVDRSGSGKISMEDAKQFVLDRFDKLDPDRDGTLTLAELQAPLRAHMEKAEGMEKQRLEASLKVLEAEFRDMDKYKDGTVSKDEYVALLEKRFNSANRDKDKTLEPRERGTAAG